MKSFTASVEEWESICNIHPSSCKCQHSSTMTNRKVFSQLQAAIPFVVLGSPGCGKSYLISALQRMQRSMHGDRDHPGIAAKQHLEESLRMQRSMHGDRDHPKIANTLQALGRLSRQAGDLPAAKQHLEESLRMQRSMHGDRDHPGIAATLHELGLLSRQAGDLPAAKQHLEESLRMQRSMHGDRDHPGIAATLHELGLLSGQAGDLPAAKQHLEESLRMERSSKRSEGEGRGQRWHEIAIGPSPGLIAIQKKKEIEPMSFVMPMSDVAIVRAGCTR